jgi:LytS/YehU family sensor histidine kinase
MQPDFPNQQMARLHRRIVGVALAAFWTAFIALYTLRSALLGFEHQDAAFVRRSLVALLGISLSWLMYRLLERLRHASLRVILGTIAATSLASALVFAAANYLVFSLTAPMTEQTCMNGLPCTLHDIVSGISDLWINWSFVFAAWGLLYLALASAAETRAADLRAGAHREAARIAEIRSLRYQINPHFLFNVLNSLTGLVSQRDTREAEALIAEIGRFFRYSLMADPLADATLTDEIGMQTRYLELERRRFPDRIEVQVEIADAAAQALLPSLILQPLIENAIKHGVSRSSAPVRITIRATATPDGQLSLVVEDNARPSEAAGDARVPRRVEGLGIGLKNVAERLALRFGDSAACLAGPLAAGGFRVELSMPLTSRA